MATKQIKPVIKPYLRGSWHGKEATRKGLKLILSILFVSFMYLLLGLLLSFESFALRVISSFVIVVFAAFYMYYRGANSGEADTAFGEIMHQHEQNGKAVTQSDRDRCFHPAKGFYEVLIALLPYLLLTLLFAALAQPLTYTLGVLPSWVEGPALQTHVGEALSYYNTQESPLFISVLRIAARAATMPFINVSLMLGTEGVLWAERLTPVWVLFAPLAYGFGYLQGPRLRIKINTGIAIGINKKNRKERKARRARTVNKSPKQLI